MKSSTSFRIPLRRLLLAFLPVMGTIAAWLVLGAPTSAQDFPRASGQNATVNQFATPTPGPTRVVGWGNSQTPGFTGGLPPTSGWAEVGGGGDLCAEVAAPPGVHYWLSLGGGLVSY